MLKKLYIYYRDTLLLMLIAVPLGAVIGSLDALFGITLLEITRVRMEHAFFLIPFLGIAGAVMMWCYQKFGGRSSKGMSLIFEAGHGISDNIPFRLVPFSIIGTWLTHLFGGSAGREGVAIQIGGTISHGLSSFLPIKNSSKLLLVTGMAAGFAGLFRTPVAATFFAIEVLTVGSLEYKALLPAMTASFTASYISGLWGLEKFHFALTENISFTWGLAIKLLFLGVIFGLAGGLFSYCLHKAKGLLSNWIHNPILRIVLMGAVISCFSLLCWGGRYSGLGTNLIAMSFDKGIYSWDFIMKFLFTILTLSAGFQGGEVTPLFAIGSSLGVTLSLILGLPAGFVAALGYAAVFGSATNTLIAPAIIGAEVFGFDYFPYFIVVCTIAYVCNGDLSIYPLQKKESV